MDFVPKLSRVACGLQCSGIWIGGKGWGLTWKMFQCIVKPREVVSVFGKCHIELSNEEKDTLEKQVILDDVTAEEMVDSGLVPQVTSVPASKPMVSTVVDDSDGEEEAVPVKEPEPIEPPTKEDATVLKKKVIKKKVG